jgi:hypothetical protein
MLSKRHVTSTTSMALEILNRALVLEGLSARIEGSQVAPLAGFSIFLTGIEPVSAGRQLAIIEQCSDVRAAWLALS